MIMNHALSPLVRQLRDIVGRRHVLTATSAKRDYLTGYRYGQGEALAVVRPGSLPELWKVAEACTRAGAIIIMQAANTGLTGGSTPDGAYDRDVVVIATMRLRRIHVLDEARQVVCLPGATLDALARKLAPYGREPHSEIGSSCLGASVTGGVCNNSGGALVRRGPAYTEAALYARVKATGELELVNGLGIDLGNAPEEMLDRLERGAFHADGPVPQGVACSARDYVSQVARVDAPTPARYNANPDYLHSASGSAGRLIVFALRLDTFPEVPDVHIVHVATDSAEDLTKLRRQMLAHEACVPVSAEYLSREMFQLAERYGKDTFLAVKLLGTQRLPLLFGLKRWVDGLAGRFGAGGAAVSDRLLQGAAGLMPAHLPRDTRDTGRRYAHHLLLKLEAGQVGFVEDMLAAGFADREISVRKYAPGEGGGLFLHRFAAAGAAIRYATLNRDRLGELVALDVALPRNAAVWTVLVPEALKDQVAGEFLYGHFFCHVFHLDLVLKHGADAGAFKQAILQAFEARGAECPAEHNVGHLYAAKPALRDFYRELDPTNSLNPGIGRTSRAQDWEPAEEGDQRKSDQDTVLDISRG